MSTLPLITQPDKRLHTPSHNLVPTALKSYQALGHDMIETMIANNGIGLAAVQIGQNVNLFVINKEVSQTEEHLVLCNPTITFASPGMTVLEEGCLSCPQRYGNVRRPEKVRVKATTLTGERLSFKAKGLLAKVFQHEIDHLRGTLIIDKFERE